jgi:hypothetical protein
VLAITSKTAAGTVGKVHESCLHMAAVMAIRRGSLGWTMDFKDVGGRRAIADDGLMPRLGDDDIMPIGSTSRFVTIPFLVTRCTISGLNLQLAQV